MLCCWWLLRWWAVFVWRWFWGMDSLAVHAVSAFESIVLHSPQRLSRCSTSICFIFIRNGLDFTRTFFMMYSGLFSWFTMAFFHFAMGVMCHGHFSFRNGRDVPWPFFFSQWAISFCAIIWIKFSSWFWVQLILQVKWNILSCMNPRRKGRLFKRGLCWIESVLSPPSAAAPSATAATPPSPLLHLRHRHTDLTGNYLRSCARNWAAMNFLHCNLCLATSVLGCSLHSLSAILCSTSRTRKNQWKLRYWRSSISKKLRYRSTKLRYLYMNFSFNIKVIFDIRLLWYRNLLWYRSIFHFEVLQYRSLKTSIWKFYEIRDFNIEVSGLRYRSPISGPISKSK